MHSLGDQFLISVIVGELGTPWDMKHENIFMGLAKGKMKADDHREPAKVSLIDYNAHVTSLQVRRWINC